MSKRHVRRRAAGWWAVVCLSLAGCASSPQEFGAFDDPVEPRTGYFGARADDFLDAFSLRLFLGPGLGARVGATSLVRAGAMVAGPSESFGEILHFDAYHVGSAGRHVGAWNVRSAEYGVAPWYQYEDDVVSVPRAGEPWYGRPDDLSPTSFDAALHLGLVGASARIDPVALGRFVLGVLGLGRGGFFDRADEDDTVDEGDPDEVPWWDLPDDQ